MTRMLRPLWLVFMCLPGVVHAAAPTNDFFATRMRITGDNFTVTSDSSEATREEGDPPIFHGLGTTLWWGYTAPRDGTLRIVGSLPGDLSFYNLISEHVYTGDSLTNLVSTQSRYRVCGDLDCGPVFDTIAGTEYQIVTDSDVPAPPLGYRGPITLQFEYLPSPTNDNFAHGTVLTGEALSVMGSTLGATREPGEPELGPNGTHSVWYSWKPPVPGRVDISGHEVANRDQRLTVYIGDSFANLVAVAQLNPCCERATTFEVAAGMTYRLSVSGEEAAPFQFSVSLNGRPILAVPRLTSDGVLLAVYGDPNSNYRIESSTNLVDWTPLKGNSLLDPSVRSTKQFYRAVFVR